MPHFRIPARPRRLAWTTLLALPLGCSPHLKPAASPEPDATRLSASTRPPVRAEETFDAVWETIATKHWDPAHNGADWTAARAEFRPQVAGCATEAEFRGLLERMIARLDQSHFGLIPREIAGGDGEPADATAGGAEADPGLTLRILDGRLVVLSVDPDGAAATAGVRPGWAVLSIDGKNLAAGFADALAEIDAAPTERDRALRSMLLARRMERPLRSDPGRSRAVAFEDADGARRVATLVPREPAGDTVKFGNLPPMRVSVRDRAIGSEEFAAAGVAADNAPRVAYVAFPIWMPAAAAPLDAAIDRYRDYDAIVLDLRGNPGGVGGMVMGFGGHFLREPVSLGTMVGRDAQLEFRVNPRRSTADGRRVEPFAGALAILVDPATASTSEIFAAGMQELGRATVVGERTAGAALPSVAERLPSGDILQYAIADFKTPQGRSVEGHGVTPDVPVDLTRESLSEGGDPALGAALRNLARRLRGNGGSASAS